MKKKNEAGYGTSLTAALRWIVSLIWFTAMLASIPSSWVIVAATRCRSRRSYLVIGTEKKSMFDRKLFATESRG